MTNRVTKTLFLVLIVVFVLSACEQTPRIAPLANDAVIVAFGDSLTFGTGANKVQSYPMVLQELTGRTVINAGVPGEESDQGLQRLLSVLEQNNPQLVILCHGGNDLLHKRNRQQLQQNLQQMIDMIRAHGAEVIMLAVPAPGITVSPPDLYEHLADANRIALDESTIPDLLSSPEMKSDPIHPNAEGYRKLAEAIRRLLIETGAVNS